MANVLRVPTYQAFSAAISEGSQPTHLKAPWPSGPTGSTSASSKTTRPQMHALISLNILFFFGTPGPCAVYHSIFPLGSTSWKPLGKSSHKLFRQVSPTTTFANQRLLCCGVCMSLRCLQTAGFLAGGGMTITTARVPGCQDKPVNLKGMKIVLD